MRRSTRRAQNILLGLVAILVSFALSNDSIYAQEVIFVKSLEEAEKAIEEARDAQADVYAPDDYALALFYLTQAKDEAGAYRATKDKQDTHLFSARKSGEAVNLLAEKAKHQAKVATTKGIEVKVDRQITAVKAQIVESFNTDVSRSFTPGREDLLGELSVREAERKEARKAREQAESELKRLTLEGEAKPTP
jgi:hypothetical protein